MVVAGFLLLVLTQVPSIRPPQAFGDSGTPTLYVVLGDSTAAGVGAPYDQGIAVLTAKHLGESRRVTLHNFAVSGARIRGVLEQQLPSAEALKPDIVLMAVGANDVTHLTSIPSMRKRFREIIDRLRSVNPRVQVVITGSPDMGSPPRIPWLLRGTASLRAKLVNRMFRGESERLNVVLAPIAERTGPLFRRDRTLFDADRFHPNARGYATWVEVLKEVLR